MRTRYNVESSRGQRQDDDVPIPAPAARPRHTYPLAEAGQRGNTAAYFIPEDLDDGRAWAVAGRTAVEDLLNEPEVSRPCDPPQDFAAHHWRFKWGSGVVIAGSRLWW